MIVERFYRLLGQYLFAIAMSDGNIHPSEESRLEKMVDDELSRHISRSHPDNKNVILAKLSFYSSLRARMHWPAGKQAFLNFLKEHKTGLDPRHKETALRMIRGMAEARKGRSRSESDLVDEAWKILETGKPEA